MLTVYDGWKSVCVCVLACVRACELKLSDTFITQTHIYEQNLIAVRCIDGLNNGSDSTAANATVSEPVI
jgi:hypothetical protein